MRIPDSLATLASQGIIEEVLRPLMSGKEAQVYLVISGGKECVAKIYKEAEHRTFKHRAEYTEGRKVRNTRDQRAINKRSSHGRAQDEAAWRSTEVEMIYRLQAAGVRVPVPHHFIDGVLVMELITDGDGDPAPRLGDLEQSRESALAIYHRLLREVVRMLCASVVHGDLSAFNVLMAGDGPVLIDFPQSVDAAHNQNARKLLLRDVDNLHQFLAHHVRDAARLPYAEEMWDLYQSNSLTPDTVLTGRYRPSTRRADTTQVLALIDDANRDERRRRDQLGLKGGPNAAARPGQDPRGPRPATPPGPQQGRPQQSRPQQHARPPQPRPEQQARPQQQPRQPPQPRQQQPQQHRPPQPARPQQPPQGPRVAPPGATAPTLADGAPRKRRRRRRRSGPGPILSPRLP